MVAAATPNGMEERIGRATAARRAVLWEQLTTGYNVVEGVVAVIAGFIAGSVAWSGSASTSLRVTLSVDLRRPGGLRGPGLGLGRSGRRFRYCGICPQGRS